MQRTLAILSTVFLTLALAACNGSAAPNAAPPSAPKATAAPTASPTNGSDKATAGSDQSSAASSGKFDGKLLFGAAVSLSGATAKEGEYTKNGYDLAVREINKAGGIKVGGKSYELAIKYYDDESKADTTARLTEKLITEDKVNLLLGPYGSGPTYSAAPIAEKYNVPMVEANGAAEKIFQQGYKYIFGVLSPGKLYLRGILDVALAKDNTLKNVAILVENDVFAIEVADGVEAYAKEKGLNVVYKEKYPSGTQDVSSLLTAAKAKNPDILLGSGHLQDSLLIMRQAKDIGVNSKVWGFSVGPSSPEFRNALKKDADYVMGGTQWTKDLKYKGNDVFSTPGNYNQLYKAAYGYEPPYQAAESSAAVIAYQKAVEAAGSTDPAQVRDALAKLDLDSFYGKIKFDERGLNTFKPMAVEQWQPDGNKYTIYPSDVAQKEALVPAPGWSNR